MQIQTDLKLIVLVDPDYRYEVNVGSVIDLIYTQDDFTSVRISFGSKEEMKAVATAMLKAANF